MGDSKEYCPRCNADLQGEPITLEAQKSYNATHFTRKTGMTDLQRDRLLYWKCPDCQGKWDV